MSSLVYPLAANTLIFLQGPTSSIYGINFGTGYYENSVVDQAIFSIMKRTPHIMGNSKALAIFLGFHTIVKPRIYKVPEQPGYLGLRSPLPSCNCGSRAIQLFDGYYSHHIVLIYAIIYVIAFVDSLKV